MYVERYRKAMVDQVLNADQELLGVKLGVLCIAKDISTIDVADYLKVPRTTVYAWFKGEAKVPRRLVPTVQEVVDKLSS